MAELVSQIQYAEMRGCTKQYISKLVQQGRITLIDGKIDPDQADQQIESTADPYHPQNLEKAKKSEDQKRYKQAKYKRLMYDTKSVKLEYEMRQNQWIDNDAFADHGFESGRVMRDQLLALPDSFGPLFYDIDGREAVYERLAEKINKIIDQSEKRTTEYINQHSQ